MSDTGLLEFPRRGEPRQPHVSDHPRITTEGATGLARAILEEAYEGAAEIRLEALERTRDEGVRLEGELKRARAAAEEAGIEARSQASVEAQLVVQRARRIAEQTMARARTEAEAIIKSAEEAASAARQQADERTTEVLAYAERVMQELDGRRLETERLEAGLMGVANDFLRWMGLPQHRLKTLVGKLRPRPAR